MTYVSRPVGTSEQELDALSRFLGTVFGRRELYVPRYLRWMYVENPAGPVVGVNAWCGDRIAGHYAVIPIRSESERGHHSSALSLNTATHPEHRGRGLFVRLAEETYALAAERGIEEIVGVANARSTPGFVRRLGFRSCGALEARLLWRPPRLASGGPAPSWRRVWNPESLRWRARTPRARYTLDTRSGVRSILGPTGWPGVRAVLRMEPAQDAVELPDLEPGRPTPLRLWLGRNAGVAQPFAGGLAIPPRLRPSPLTLIHRSLDRSGWSPEPERIRFEAFDFDAY
jgi:GNAT superfamily N-acetyltransferase